MHTGSSNKEHKTWNQILMVRPLEKRSVWTRRKIYGEDIRKLWAKYSKVLIFEMDLTGSGPRLMEGLCVSNIENRGCITGKLSLVS